eukprot:5415-Heterococcus_DN1.PRE.3
MRGSTEHNSCVTYTTTTQYIQELVTHCVKLTRTVSSGLRICICQWFVHNEHSLNVAPHYTTVCELLVRVLAAAAIA